MAFPEPQHYGGSAGPGGFAPPQQQQQQAPCGGHDQQYGGAYPQASPYQSSYPQAPQYGQHDASQYGQQQYAQSSPYGGTSSPAPGGEASGYYGQQGAPSHDQYGQPGQQQQQPVQYDEQGNPIGPNGERGIGTMALGGIAGLAASKIIPGHQGKLASMGTGALLAQGGKMAYDMFNKNKKQSSGHHTAAPSQGYGGPAYGQGGPSPYGAPQGHHGGGGFFGKRDI